jgi:hypothetical protein
LKKEIAYTFKEIIKKRESHDRRSTKIFGNRKNSKFHTLALLDQSV